MSHAVYEKNYGRSILGFVIQPPSTLWENAFKVALYTWQTNQVESNSVGKKLWLINFRFCDPAVLYTLRGRPQGGPQQMADQLALYRPSGHQGPGILRSQIITCLSLYATRSEPRPRPHSEAARGREFFSPPQVKSRDTDAFKLSHAARSVGKNMLEVIIFRFCRPSHCLRRHFWSLNATNIFEKK